MPIKHPCVGIGCGKPVKSNQKSLTHRYSHEEEFDFLAYYTELHDICFTSNLVKFPFKV